MRHNCVERLFYALVNKGKKRTGRGCKRAPTLVMRLQEVRIVLKAAIGVCLALYGGGTVPILATVLYPFRSAPPSLLAGTFAPKPPPHQALPELGRLAVSCYCGEGTRASCCSSSITVFRVSSISNENRTMPLF
jgi:hypothetical protein